MSFFIGEGGVFWRKRVGNILWGLSHNFVRALMIGGALTTSFLIFAEVFFRYVVYLPILWVEELTIYLVMWFYMAGALYASYNRSHIVCGVVNVLIKNKRPGLLPIFDVATSALCLVLSGVMVILTYKQFTYSLTVDPRTIHLFLSLAYARLALLFGFSAMSLYYLVELIGFIRGLLRGVPVKMLGSEG